jgi:copper/silver efflux system protein
LDSEVKSTLALAIIAVLLMTFTRPTDVIMVFLAVPMSLSSGLWPMWLLGYNLSRGVAVDFIALGELAAEVGVIMIVYLNQALQHWHAEDPERGSHAALPEAIVDGALRRVRPITMTQATVFLGLLPIMIGTATGSEIMQRIAAPMVGGVSRVWIVALLVLPAI